MQTRCVATYDDQKRMMNLSLAAAVVLLGAKVTAAVVTKSSTVYSDAAESLVHLLAVGFATWALRLAHKPVDETHHFGHDKVRSFAPGSSERRTGSSHDLTRMTLMNTLGPGFTAWSPTLGGQFAKNTDLAGVKVFVLGPISAESARSPTCRPNR